MNMVPMSNSVMGSIHSHPGKSYSPSDADLNFFNGYSVNIITKYPYESVEDVAFYNSIGERVVVEIMKYHSRNQENANLTCPMCKGSRIKMANTDGLGVYDSADQRYICEDCGYIGSLILDTAEHEKTALDIAMEEDLRRIKKEIELEEILGN